MKLISWNVNRARSSRAREQVEALALASEAHLPDVVALQEVSSVSIPVYKETLEGIGLSEIVHTLDSSLDVKPAGVLVASQFGLARIPLPELADVLPEGTWTSDRHEIETHWRLHALRVGVASPAIDFDLFNVYITPGSHHVLGTNGRLGPYLKLDLLSAVYHSLASGTSRYHVLCGDFNTPQEEKSNCEIVTWGYDWERGSYRLRRPDQHAVEWNILRELAQYEMRDVYREFHGYANAGSDEAISYLKTYRARRDERRRYDHIFASRTLIPRSARYLIALRVQGLSDHAPLEVVLEHDSELPR